MSKRFQVLSLSEYETLSGTPRGVPPGTSVFLSPSEYEALFRRQTPAEQPERSGRLSDADLDVMHGDAYHELRKAFFNYLKTLETVKALPDPQDFAVVTLLQIGLSAVPDNARIAKAVAAVGLSGHPGGPEIDDHRALLEMARHVLNGVRVTPASLKAAAFAPNRSKISLKAVARRLRTKFEDQDYLGLVAEASSTSEALDSIAAELRAKPKPRCNFRYVIPHSPDGLDPGLLPNSGKR